MQTRLVAIGNSYGIRLPKTLIKQFDLDKGEVELVVKKEGILITPAAAVAPLSEWDALFKQAKKKGFNPSNDLDDFSAWDTTLTDGLD